MQDAGKTVFDRISGLHWQRGSSDGPNWTQAKTWCSANTPALPGSGWRMPTTGELVTLVDRKQIEPAIDPVFMGTPTIFWSSTPYASGGSVWCVHFAAGNALNVLITDTFSVRCVR